MRPSVLVFSALGGFLFGYDTSVINGAMFQMRDYFGFDEHSWQAGLVVSIAVIGAFFGALVAGFVASVFGRRMCIAVADVLFTVGSVLMAAVPYVPAVLVGRLIVGFGIGLCSCITPVYLAEITSSSKRGAVIVLNNVILTGAQFIASGICALLVQFTSANVGWRVALGLGAVPSVVQLIGLIVFLPESPRWLMCKGRTEEARRVAEEFDIDLAEEDLNMSVDLDYRKLIHPDMRERLLIGVMLHVFQQFSGINTIMYYSSVILYDAGFRDPKTPVILSVPLAFLNSAFTVLGIFTVDHWGRRRLLQISAIGCVGITIVMTVVGFLLGAQISYAIGSWLFLALLGVYLAFFAPGLGAMPWVVIGEIFPNHLRTPAASVATMANWASNAAVSQLFPMMLGWIGVGGTFAVVCGCIALATAFIFIFVKETKGLTLEEIDVMFTNRNAKRRRKNRPANPGEWDDLAVAEDHGNSPIGSTGLPVKPSDAKSRNGMSCSGITATEAVEALGSNNGKLGASHSPQGAMEYGSTEPDANNNSTRSVSAQRRNGAAPAAAASDRKNKNA